MAQAALWRPLHSHVQMEGHGSLHCSACSLNPGMGHEPGLGPALPLLGRAGLSQKELGTWHTVPGWKDELGEHCEMWGWMDRWIDGRTDSYVRVEINLFFPEPVFLLGSGHSQTG